jgi:hypothetical protein
MTSHLRKPVSMWLGEPRTIVPGRHGVPSLLAGASEAAARIVSDAALKISTRVTRVSMVFPLLAKPQSLVLRLQAKGTF